MRLNVHCTEAGVSHQVYHRHSTVQDGIEKAYLDTNATQSTVSIYRRPVMAKPDLHRRETAVNEVAATDEQEEIVDDQDDQFNQTSAPIP